ncbi:calcium/sodium antiporter [Paraglaciecola aquimarina]|uniref:Calcium/sodium antiporter n=1 Tax=Paraglaciecola algarum TaxID=3050085 RepID=A0ABS9D8B6_9ALTE|nr:calcium/sodium antiporter [Paraglaciecola sp. G1-23]MCF2949201.1 calcium/sodium antiporter [Paraglaciecola sp. G1-23]
MDFVLILVGIILLTVGGEALIHGAMGSAKRLKISPVMSGIIIVGFGTSAPELAVSIDAALSGNSDLAIGNVVGSNIGNVLLILGLCAVIKPLTIQPKILHRDAMIAVLASIIASAALLFNILNITGGILLVGLLITYLVVVFNSEKDVSIPSAQLHISESKEITMFPSKDWLLIVSVLMGLMLLIGGSKVLLLGAVGLAKDFGVSEAAIGLTLVAVGTSLPELSISVIAVFRKHTDVAIGNVLGSNIFNILGILGASAMLQPLTPSSRMLSFDLWVMLAAIIALVFILKITKKLSRVTGGLLLICYSGYVYLSFNL